MFIFRVKASRLIYLEVLGLALHKKSPTRGVREKRGVPQFLVEVSKYEVGQPWKVIKWDLLVKVFSKSKIFERRRKCYVCVEGLSKGEVSELTLGSKSRYFGPASM